MEEVIMQRKKYHTPSKEELKNKVIAKMKELDLWREGLEEEIPSYWDNFTNFVIFNSKFFSDKYWEKAGPHLWECISKLFSNKSIAIQGKIQNDSFRSPNAMVVHGKSPWVEFIDNGIIYTWNVGFTMFCTGNISERHRIAGLDCKEHIIVDMFAGIGYFTIPYLVHARAKQVVACDWNPVSVQALKINLVKNKVDEKCIVLEGDVRLTCPRGIADEINLGLIPSCVEYWQVAAEILKPSGGIIRVHENVNSFLSKTDTKFQINCQECTQLIQKLAIDLTLTKNQHFQDFEVQIFEKERLSYKVKESRCVKWKKLQWFIWSVHVSHEFCKLLSVVNNQDWSVTPVFLHRIKGYAPHIDHIVMDICCTPLNV